MSAVDFISVFQESSKLISRKEDDMFDRLSNRWSIALLIVITMLITSYSYIGDPIDCYEPQEFEDQWVEYMDNVCWVSNTYFIPFNESIPHAKDEYKQELQYYQWVPIILVIQAVMFMLPGLFWNSVSDSAGYNIKDIVDVCNGAESLNPETRDASIGYLINNMVRFMNYRKPYKNFKAPMGKRYGRYIFIIYMITKCLYIANAIGQIYLITSIVGNGYATFGWDAVYHLILDKDWVQSPVFPRVTLCSFKIRKLGENVQRYTVQCLLSVNLFNEMAYVVIWWWLVLVAIMSILGLLVWIFTSITPSSQRNYVIKYLKIMKRPYDTDAVDEFVTVFLRTDGVFTLRLIKKNTNDVITGEIVAALWDKYVALQKKNSLLENGEEESIA